MDQFVVISYDIPDDRRRRKVANLLLDFGAQRVQWSVFECYSTPRNLERLHARLEKVYDKETDSIRIYWLCANCRPRMLMLGVAQATDEPGLRIV